MELNHLKPIVGKTLWTLECPGLRVGLGEHGGLLEKLYIVHVKLFW